MYEIITSPVSLTILTILYVAELWWMSRGGKFY